MKVSKEEILHIANLAEIELKDEEIDKYTENVQEILNFADIINNANVDDVDITIGTGETANIFRKDEVKVFDNIEGLLQNAPERERNMFKIPKVIQ